MTRSVQVLVWVSALVVALAVFQLYRSPEMIYHVSALRLC